MNALEFAIKMELDGEKYYREKAELNKDNSLHRVCVMLADDEQKHAFMLTEKLQGKSYELKDSAMLSDTKNVFQEINAMKNDDLISQLEFYRTALQKEKESIELYQDLLSKAVDENEKELFTFMIKEESHHQEIFEELVMMLQNASEWVESAEFGIRKEY